MNSVTVVPLIYRINAIAEPISNVTACNKLVATIILLCFIIILQLVHNF